MNEILYQDCYWLPKNDVILILSTSIYIYQVFIYWKYFIKLSFSMAFSLCALNIISVGLRSPLAAVELASNWWLLFVLVGIGSGFSLTEKIKRRKKNFAINKNAISIQCSLTNSFNDWRICSWCDVILVGDTLFMAIRWPITITWAIAGNTGRRGFFWLELQLLQLLPINTKIAYAWNFINAVVKSCRCCNNIVCKSVSYCNSNSNNIILSYNLRLIYHNLVSSRRLIKSLNLISIFIWGLQLSNNRYAIKLQSFSDFQC